MAKHDKPISNKPSKMTVMLFQLEGNDETLQEGFRTINNAIDKLANPVLRVIAQPSGTALALPKPQGDQDAIDVEPDEDSEDETAAADASKTSKNGVARKFPVPIVLDLDLTQGNPPLKEYLEQKKPKSDIRRYLLIAAWLKENLKIDEVGINHIYTGYRAMNWQSPDDVAAPLRSMRQKHYGYFNKGKEKGFFAINHIGIGEANKANEE